MWYIGVEIWKKLISKPKITKISSITALKKGFLQARQTIPSTQNPFTTQFCITVKSGFTWVAPELKVNPKAVLQVDSTKLQTWQNEGHADSRVMRKISSKGKSYIRAVPHVCTISSFLRWWFRSFKKQLLDYYWNPRILTKKSFSGETRLFRYGLGVSDGWIRFGPSSKKQTPCLVQHCRGTYIWRPDL